MTWTQSRVSKMTRIDLATLKFWNAALFIRRAPDRDQNLAQRVLRDVAKTTTGTLHQRATELMKEPNNGTGRCYPG